jgi:hypothetical protein
MPGRPRQDRSTVASGVLSVRLTPVETQGLDRLVASHNAHLRTMRMPPYLNRAAFVRSLVLRELEAFGLVDAPDNMVPSPEPLTLQPPRKRTRRDDPPLPPPVCIRRSVQVR